MPENFHCQHVPKVSISKVQGVLIKKGSFGGLSPGGAESAPEKWVAAGSPGPAASSRRTPEAHLPKQGRRLRLPEPGPCPERNPSPGAAFADTVGSREAGQPLRGQAFQTAPNAALRKDSSGSRLSVAVSRLSLLSELEHQKEHF